MAHIDICGPPSNEVQSKLMTRLSVSAYSLFFHLKRSYSSRADEKQSLPFVIIAGAMAVSVSIEEIP